MDKGYFDLPTSVGKCLSIMICIRMQFRLRTRNQSSFQLCNKTNDLFFIIIIKNSTIQAETCFCRPVNKVSVQGRSLQNNWNGPLKTQEETYFRTHCLVDNTTPPQRTNHNNMNQHSSTTHDL